MISNKSDVKQFATKTISIGLHDAFECMQHRWAEETRKLPNVLFGNKRSKRTKKAPSKLKTRNFSRSY
jgi:hypothetical protein